MASGMWKRALLGDHVDLLTGYPFKSQSYTDDGNDIRLLRGDNIGQGFLRWDAVKRWPRGNAGDYNGFNVERGDVVLAMDRPWIEAGLKWAAIVESDVPALLVQRVARMRGVNGLQTAFLRYVISSRNFTDYVKAITTGVNVPHISGPDIRKFSFRIPPEPVQMRIAWVLSTYDDLIENNTKRIKILEEMARSLYREWFVNFRFPGHEKTKFIKSPLGMIPADWRVDRLDSALVLQRGFDLPVGARVPGTVPIYAATGVVGTHEIAKAKGPGVVTGRSGSLGTVLFVREDYWPLNTALWVKEFRSVGPVLAYFLLSNLDLKGMDGGAAVPTLNRNHAHALNVAIPPVGLVHHFEALADDFLRQTEILAKASDILRVTRDLLLPRLLSGEIDVSSLPLEPAAS